MRNKNVTDERWATAVNAAAKGAHEAFCVFARTMGGGAPLPWDQLTSQARDNARKSAEEVMTGEEPVTSLFEEIAMTIAMHMGVLDEEPHHHEPCPACGDPGPERYGPPPKTKSALSGFLDTVFKSVGRGIAEYAAEQGIPIPSEAPPADPELEKTMDELQQIGLRIFRGEVDDRWVSAHVADLCQRHGPERVQALDLLFTRAAETGEIGPRATSSAPSTPPTT